MFGLIVVVWAAYGITDASSQDTYKCPDTFTCVENPNQDLPGGGHDPKFSMSPWSIGQRDCFWFSCNPERCALPALFSEAKDLCIDMAYWKTGTTTTAYGGIGTSQAPTRCGVPARTEPIQNATPNLRQNR